jgi:hypothetical protein
MSEVFLRYGVPVIVIAPDIAAKAQILTVAGSVGLRELSKARIEVRDHKQHVVG